MAKTPPFSLCNEFCVGGGGNPNSKTTQSDYEQNDSSKPDYIKNRPFYDDASEGVKQLDEKFIPGNIARIAYVDEKIEDVGIKNTASGELISLSDSAEAPIAGLKIFGSAKQKTAYGYQMFDKSMVSMWSDVTPLMWNNDGTITVTEPYVSDMNVQLTLEASDSLEPGVYYMTVERLDGREFSEGDCFIQLKDEQHLDDLGPIVVKTECISAGVKYKCKLEIPEGFSRDFGVLHIQNAPTGTTLKVMLSQQPDAEWEPYTGGEILPRPDAIEKVVGTGANGSITGHCIGNNLCPNDTSLIKEIQYYGEFMDLYSTFGYVTNNIPAGEYTVSFKGQNNVQDGDVLRVIIVTDFLAVDYEANAYSESGIYIIDYGPGAMNTGATLINIPANRKIIVSLGDNLESAKDLLERIEIQVRPTVPADHEDIYNPTFVPYTGKGFTIPISKELLAFPDLGIYDYIDTKQDARIEKVKKLVLDGTEDWVFESRYGMRFRLSDEIQNALKLSGDKPSVMCDEYKGVLFDYSDNPWIDYSVKINSNGFYIYICDPNYTDKSKWKAHLEQRYVEGNPVTLYLAMRYDERTPLTEEEKQALKDLATHYPSTFIYNNEGAHMEINYVADTKNYIDNKISKAVEEIQNAIISIGGNV